MTVLDDHNGVLGILGAQVVNDDLAVGAELTGDTLGQLFTEFDFIGFHGYKPLSNFLLGSL